MNTEHQYQLQKGSKKYQCPECLKRTFKRYIDTGTDSYLPEQYGRCDREIKCAYHLNPYKDGYARNARLADRSLYDAPVLQLHRHTPKPKPAPDTVYFDFNTFKATLSTERYIHNCFLQNLLERVSYPFDLGDVTKVVELYRLGTIAKGYRAGATTFPFIDRRSFVRAVQVKQFDDANRSTTTDFLHSIIERHYTRNGKPLPQWLDEYNKLSRRVSCLFGEHLLEKYPHNPVALVEAPKTAIYATLYFGLPDDSTLAPIWLAVYNKSSFTLDRLQVLKGKDVLTFPDLSKDGSTFREWQTKAREYEMQLAGTRFLFSDLLERLAPNEHREQGLDIADFLIQLDWRLFRGWRKTTLIEKCPENTADLKAHTQAQGQPDALEELLEFFSRCTYTDEATASVPKRVECVENDAHKNSFIFDNANLTAPRNQRLLNEDWSSELSELEDYFSKTELPTVPLIIEKGSIITDAQLFVSGHLATVKANQGTQAFLPYLKRLRALRQTLTSNQYQYGSNKDRGS